MSLLRVSDEGDWIDCVAISHFSKARARTGNRGCLKLEKTFQIEERFGNNSSVAILLVDRPLVLFELL